MTPLELFLVLLAVAFFGGVRVARGSNSFWGFSSGVEYLVLGVLLGPHLLGLVTARAVDDFNAPLLMGLAWFFSARGLSFGWLGERRTPMPRLLASLFASAAGSAGVYGAARLTAEALSLSDAHTLALGLAAVSGESAQRAGAASAQLDSSRSWTTGTELVPLLFLGAMVVGGPLLAEFPSPLLQSLLLSVLLGVLLGGVVTALLAARFERAEVWPLLLGSVLLVAGTALRVQLPAATSAFVLGLVVSLASRHRRRLRALVSPTERQLLLPCLLLAGIVLSWPERPALWALVGGAVAARLALKLLQGKLVGLQSELLHTSGFTLALGLVVFLRQSDEVGRVVLTAAVINVVLGELLVPRRAVTAAQSQPAPSLEGAAEEAGS